MAGLTVLNEPEVRALLENLTYDEFESFRDPLRAALHDYSTGTQSSQNADIHQPRRTAITSSSNGSEVMFVPSSNIGGVSMKVLTLPDRKAEDNAIGSENLVRARGAITLYNRVGDPVGFVPAQTVTAFRTALASTCLLQRRKRMRQITVFGCGEQAYWHVRLALLMRGDSIRTVNIINRRFSEHARLIFKRLASTPGAVKEREGWADAKIGLLTPGYGEYARLVEEHLVESDAIFCCTPSTEPLFDPAILTSYEARAKGRVIVAIGSYKREMRELPVELLRQATRQGSKGGHHHHHKHAIEGGVIVVDTLDGALQEAGEIIEAGLQPNQLVELGELVMLRRNAIGGEAERDDDNDNTCSVPAAEFERLNMSSSSSLKSSSTLSSSTTTQDSASSPNSSQQTLPLNESENGGGRGGSEDGSQHGSSTHHGHRRSTSGGKSGGSHHERKKSSHRHHHHHHRPQQSGSHDAKGSSSKDHETDHLARWMSSGNIVYKGVGLGLMDLAVGMRLIELAKEKGVGTYIEGF